MTSPIRHARPNEIPSVAALIAHAFNNLAQTHSLVPHADHRLPVMTAYFELAITAATVHVIPDPDDHPIATSVWFDRTHPEPPNPTYANHLATITGPYLPNFQALDNLLAAHHPPEPHWHLAFLAVHPHHRHSGHGVALLTHTHATLTTPAYLEATNEANLRLYRRHGYKTLHPFAIHLPDGTPFYRMWRRP
ncbi:hypothetical protein GCM10010435_71830 [Winogradskya consettensis]|uniref:N-acetyltransferase domain-containing protein n=1 Tax=Winogradskya consettensis TaxID=113560 RepID=A0A919SU36_9ACTN|nr:GNAT family N-acetyltransferase [Actinoplanes consettensis]GIM77644.1 hypothetical protein Aco04nite_56400 [Actinoplanes consettensis]